MEALAAFGISARVPGVVPPSRVLFDWHGVEVSVELAIDIEATPDMLRADAQIHACNVYHGLPGAEYMAQVRANREAVAAARAAATADDGEESDDEELDLDVPPQEWRQ